MNMLWKKIEVRKKVFIDVCLNIVASALPIAMLQLIIYPKVANVIGGDEYGLMLTIYSVWVMIPNSLGNVLNNIKLLRYQDYKTMQEEGDVALLLREWSVVSTLIVFFIIWVYVGGFSFTHVILGSLISICILLKGYLEVGFRINLNFVSILFNNIILSAGFLLGFVLFRITNIWEFIFLLGYASSMFYCIIKTRLLYEKPKKTMIYKEVNKDAYSLVVSVIINNLINYADKLVIYPLMGGTAVSIYYTATILGKITGMLTGPINSVVLSYISRWDKTKSNIFTKILFLGIITISIGYGITIICAKPVIGVLFPQWLDEVMAIIPITTVTVMLTVLTSFLQPFVLKFCKMQWQMFISAIGSASYFVCAIIMWKYMGLKGFCIGTIVGIVVKLSIMIIVYYKSTLK